MIKPTRSERAKIRDWILAGDGAWIDLWFEPVDQVWACEIDDTGIIFENVNAPSLLREIAGILEEI